MIRADYRGRGGEGSRGDDVMVLRREMQKDSGFYKKDGKSCGEYLKKHTGTHSYIFLHSFRLQEVQFGTERQLEDGDKGEHSSIRWQSIGNLGNFGKSGRLEHVCI